MKKDMNIVAEGSIIQAECFNYIRKRHPDLDIHFNFECNEATQVEYILIYFGDEVGSIDTFQGQALKHLIYKFYQDNKIRFYQEEIKVLRK